MKTIRKFLSPLSFFLATLILFTSCEQYDNNLGTNLSEHNEVELFKSIIFADGEITNNFETLADSRKMIENFDSEQLTKYRETQTKVINFITENNPIGPATNMAMNDISKVPVNTGTAPKLPEDPT